MTYLARKQLKPEVAEVVWSVVKVQSASGWQVQLRMIWRRRKRGKN